MAYKLFEQTAQDLGAGLQGWRIWLMLAGNDIARRYRRSRIGQLWLTLSMAVLIAGLGTIYSNLFQVHIVTYIPYISITFIVWGLLQGIVIESCSAFIDGETILRNMAIPKSIFLFRVVTRNLLIFLHNALLIPLVFIWFGKSLNYNFFFIIPGLLLVLINLFLFGFILSIIATRFRDLPQIIQSLMQLIFFITPVVFQPDQLHGPQTLILAFNPFASFLALIRDPLLGISPNPLDYYINFFLLGIGLLCTSLFVGRYAKRIVYWL